MKIIIPYYDIKNIQQKHKTLIDILEIPIVKGKDFFIGKESLQKNLSVKILLSGTLEEFSSVDGDFIRQADYLGIYKTERDTAEDLVEFFHKFPEKEKLVFLPFQSNFSSVIKIIHALKSFVKNYILYPQDDEKNLLSYVSIEDLAKLLKEIEVFGLLLGFSGKVEEPDIVRYYNCGAHYLHLRGENYQNLFAVLQKEKSCFHSFSSKKIVSSSKLDAIVITDYILPMEIGAYQREHGKKQNVCFNITAYLARPLQGQRTMQDVFSYDIILDGIKIIAARGHILLVEQLAEDIAEFILSHAQIARVCVRVEKLDLEAKAVGVEIERLRA